MSSLECLVSNVRKGIEGTLLESCLVELVLYGSIVRGDYDSDISDIDLFYIVNDACKDDITRINHVLGNITESALRICGVREPRRGIDLAWCLRSEIESSSALCEYKFLTLYREDFEQSSILVLGEKLHTLLPAPSPEDAVRQALKRLSRRVVEFAEKNPSLLPILAGEVAKLVLLSNGYKGPWVKQAVYRALQRTDPVLADIWRNYLDGKPLPAREALQVIRYALNRLCGGKFGGECRAVKAAIEEARALLEKKEEQH